MTWVVKGLVQARLLTDELARAIILYELDHITRDLEWLRTRQREKLQTREEEEVPSLVFHIALVTLCFILLICRRKKALEPVAHGRAQGPTSYPIRKPRNLNGLPSRNPFTLNGFRIETLVA